MNPVDGLPAAISAISAGCQAIERVPHAHNALLLALEEHLDPPQTMVIRGEGEALERWHARCLLAYAPRRLSVAIPSSEQSLPGMLGERVAKDGVVAYVCEGHVCRAPVTTFEDLDAALAALETEVKVEEAE